MDGAQLLLVIVAAIAVTALANRRGLQPPLVVVTVGLVVSFVPGLPRLELEPDIILGLVLPPLSSTRPPSTCRCPASCATWGRSCGSGSCWW